MREATARGPSIDISEFERRLRGAEPAEEKRAGDPLAELARLLQGDEGAPAADPYRQMFATEPPRGESEQAQPPVHQPVHHDQFEAETLRGSLPPSSSHEDPYFSVEQAEAEWRQQEAQDYLDYGLEPEPQSAYDEEEPRKRLFARLRSGLKPLHAVVGVAILGAVSVGWGFAHRGGVVAPREVALIKAPEGPTKVQPSSVGDAAATPQKGATILDRNQSAPVKKVVTSEEQPIDPAAAMRVVQLGDGPVDAPHFAPTAGAYGAEPRKVKTVSVRPDGTVIENDAPPAAAAQAAAPARPSRIAALIGQPTTPDGMPTVTPKSPLRPATTPQAAPPPRPKPAKPVAKKPPPPPAAETAALEVPAAAAPAAEAAAPANSSGAFAVQFGAAGSEAEARRLIQRVSAKYGAQLGGRRLGFHLAKVGEKSVYRVRAAGMSREAAVQICGQVKGAGGTCFVAAN